MSNMASRAQELWEFTGAELGKRYEYNTSFTICLVLAAALLDWYDSGIIPDANENGNSPENDIRAAIERLEREGWR